MLKKNLFFSYCIAAYTILLLSIIQWGIPNENRLFTYHMDEWHQMQSVKNLFRYGSSNMEGSANGPVFQFIVTGIYLGFFFLTRIINPFSITSSVDMLTEQHKLFLVLRLNTLLFGILTLIVLGVLSKKILKSSPVITILLMVTTPIWLVLSNYFKYDIALIFWMSLSLYSFLQFPKQNTAKSFLIAGVITGLTIATKISALPMIPLYIIAFFMFSKKRNFAHLTIGIVALFVVLLMFGLPDILLHKNNYLEFLVLNLHAIPGEAGNFITGQHWMYYLFTTVLPLDFGYVLWYVSFFVVCFFTTMIALKKIDGIEKKYIVFLLLGFFLFFVSLYPLKIYAGGNKLLVLLPFLVLLTTLFIHKCKRYFKNNLLTIFFYFAIILQMYQSFPLISMKWGEDPREVSSQWILHNIPTKSTVGIENIPIYQMLPDRIVKEFYSTVYGKKIDTTFTYVVVDANTKKLPQYIVITNAELDVNYLQRSPKKDLLQRMNREQYKKMIEFKPAPFLYYIMKNELNMYTSGLNATPTITFFEKKN